MDEHNINQPSRAPITRESIFKPPTSTFGRRRFGWLYRTLRIIDFEHPVTAKSKSLICIAIIALAHGYGYFTAPSSITPLPPALVLISEVIPVQVWGCVWFASGIGAVWAALYKPIIAAHPVKNVFQAAMVGMFMLWGLAYLVTWAMAPSGRVWVVGLLYVGAAGHMFFTRRLVPPLPRAEFADIPPYVEGMG